jgi:hypothetical protein
MRAFRSEFGAPGSESEERSDSLSLGPSLPFADRAGGFRSIGSVLRFFAPSPPTTWCHHAAWRHCVAACPPPLGVYSLASYYMVSPCCMASLCCCMSSSSPRSILPRLLLHGVTVLLRGVAAWCAVLLRGVAAWCHCVAACPPPLGVYSLASYYMVSPCCMVCCEKRWCVAASFFS